MVFASAISPSCAETRYIRLLNHDYLYTRYLHQNCKSDIVAKNKNLVYITRGLSSLSCSKFRLRHVRLIHKFCIKEICIYMYHHHILQFSLQRLNYYFIAATHLYLSTLWLASRLLAQYATITLIQLQGQPLLPGLPLECQRTPYLHIFSVDFPLSTPALFHTYKRSMVLIKLVAHIVFSISIFI